MRAAILWTHIIHMTRVRRLQIAENRVQTLENESIPEPERHHVETSWLPLLSISVLTPTSTTKKTLGKPSEAKWNCNLNRSTNYTEHRKWEPTSAGVFPVRLLACLMGALFSFVCSCVHTGTDGGGNVSWFVCGWVDVVVPKCLWADIILSLFSYRGPVTARLPCACISCSFGAATDEGLTIRRSWKNCTRIGHFRKEPIRKHWWQCRAEVCFKMNCFSTKFFERKRNNCGKRNFEMILYYIFALIINFYN